MKTERIGLRFSRKDEDIVSWFLMLKENKIEQSFAVKALLKSFFLNEHINAGIVKIRHDGSMEPTSISINENALNNDIMKIKLQGIKLATFTKDIIRSYISIGNEDKIPDYSELQRIHTKYKLKYLNSILYNDIMETAVTSNYIDKGRNYEKSECSKSDSFIENDSNHIESKNNNAINDSQLNVTDTHTVEDINKKRNEYKSNHVDENIKASIKEKPKNKKRNPLLAQI